MGLLKFSKQKPPADRNIFRPCILNQKELTADELLSLYKPAFLSPLLLSKKELKLWKR